MRGMIAAVVIMYLSLACDVRSAEAANTGVRIWYKPGIAPIPVLSGLPPVAVYLFRDSRQSPCGPNCIPYLFPDVAELPWAHFLNPIRTGEPVVLPVTSTFAEGLRARGFPVVDRTHRVFEAGESTDGAQRGLRGELLRFASFPRTTMNPLDRIVCVVGLEVFDLESGRKIWEKTYSGAAWIDGASRQSMPLGSEGEKIEPFLATALGEAVENAVMDPELTAELGRPSS